MNRSLRCPVRGSFARGIPPGAALPARAAPPRLAVDLGALPRELAVAGDAGADECRRAQRLLVEELHAIRDELVGPIGLEALVVGKPVGVDRVFFRHPGRAEELDTAIRLAPGLARVVDR